MVNYLSTCESRVVVEDFGDGVGSGIQQFLRRQLSYLKPTSKTVPVIDAGFDLLLRFDIGNRVAT